MHRKTAGRARDDQEMGERRRVLGTRAGSADGGTAQAQRAAQQLLCGEKMTYHEVLLAEFAADKGFEQPHTRRTPAQINVSAGAQGADTAGRATGGATDGVYTRADSDLGAMGAHIQPA